MKDKIFNILENLDTLVSEKVSEARKNSEMLNGHYEIKIVGQASLLLNTEFVAKFSPVATIDLDTKVKGDYWITNEFKKLLKAESILYDEDGELIWLPSETMYLPFFDGIYIKAEIIAPIYCLTSKAIKAPLKNKALIQEALIEYGNELKNLIVKYGGNLEVFYE